MDRISAASTKQVQLEEEDVKMPGQPAGSTEHLLISVWALKYDFLFIQVVTAVAPMSLSHTSRLLEFPDPGMGWGRNEAATVYPKPTPRQQKVAVIQTELRTIATFLVFLEKMRCHRHSACPG